MSRVTALDVAAYLVQRASQIDEADLTNLKLQKLLYFAQGRYLANTGNPLFDDEIEAWQYGPVVRSVYDAYKTCGAFPITTFDVKTTSRPLPDDLGAFVDSIWEEYGKYSAGYLVNLTHHERSPWRRHYQPQCGSEVIPKEELRAYFEKHKTG